MQDNIDTNKPIKLKRIRRSLSMKLGPKLRRRNSIIQEIEEENDKVEFGMRRQIAVNYRIYLIFPDEAFKQLWDGIVLLFIIYSALVLPFRIAYQDSEEEDFSWILFDSFLDLIFFIDMLLCCFTAFINVNNEIVVSHKQIFINYLRTGLFFDLILNFPYQLLEQLPGFQIFRAVRVIKSLRMLKATQKFQKMFELLFKACKISLSLGNLTFFFSLLCLFINNATCIWIIIGRNQLLPDTWITAYGIYDFGFSTYYISSTYWVTTTIFTVGFGDIIPVNDAEKAFAIITMGIGVFFYSYIISSINLMLNLRSKSKYSLNNSLRSLHEINKKYKIPKSLYKKIEKYLKSDSRQSRIDYNSFALSLSSRVSQQLIFIMNKQLVDGNLFFQSKPESFIKAIILHLKPLKVELNEVFVEKGDLACEIYFLNSGQMAYFIDEDTFETIEPEDYFGDAEIFHRDYRDFNIKSVKVSELFALESLILVKYLTDYEEVMCSVVSIAHEKWKILHKMEQKIKLKKRFYENNFPDNEENKSDKASFGYEYMPTE